MKKFADVINSVALGTLTFLAMLLTFVIVPVRDAPTVSALVAGCSTVIAGYALLSLKTRRRLHVEDFDVMVTSAIASLLCAFVLWIVLWMPVELAAAVFIILSIFAMAALNDTTRQVHDAKVSPSRLMNVLAKIVATVCLALPGVALIVLLSVDKLVAVVVLVTAAVAALVWYMQLQNRR